MMNSELLASLIAFALIGTFTPGGATVLIAASGARFGFRSSVPLLVGIVIGLASLVALAGAGIGALLQSAPTLQLLMRVGGSAYLLWLAWKIAQIGAPDIDGGATAQPESVLSGLVLLWLNPKGWTMALGASAAYSELTTDPTSLALLLGSVFAGASSLALTFWCASGL
ncbi:MAG TPA: LysE family transporter, partial [Arenibaculum sp.]|nr:LysE family transporter [Arenibaculum sp.]